MLQMSDVSAWNRPVFPKILKIFEKLEVNGDPSNVEDCHWTSSKNDPKRVIVKVSKRKDTSKIRSAKKKTKRNGPNFYWYQQSRLHK